MHSQHKPVKGRDDLVKTSRGVVLNIDKQKLARARALKQAELAQEERFKLLESRIAELERRLGI